MGAFFKNCSDNRMINFLIQKKYRIWRHALVLLYITIFFCASKLLKDSREPFDLVRSMMWNFYFLSMFYLNMYLLVPKLLYKGDYVKYIFILLLLIIGGYFSFAYFSELYLDGYVLTRSHSSKKMHLSGDTFHEYFVAVHMILLMVFASTSIKLFQRWARDNQRINELETNSLQMELRELRNQVNPHFLFNMLNNVNVLVRKNPDKAVNVIHKLSDFLRYQLYENNAQSVLLLPEIQFLTDFMELEKTRRDEFTFSLDIENNLTNQERVHNFEVPPNLFISFVENAIKHSADAENPSSVQVVFSLFDDRLEFSCANTKPEETTVKTAGGLGLANAKRRLELLYADAFTLGISQSKRKYELKLMLPI
ncbi:MAG: histidine kinase [Flavobacterium sp.]|uniref:sensor histidine kinase n=1 Tax=Flavobacterium sp. TaxID=239 RepID=UPI001222456B|nr:histidine kinase [Flavobacterium sp.]RZJ65912.1 MAG: histidine kinase [Flavobacterium sp.]